MRPSRCLSVATGLACAVAACLPVAGDAADTAGDVVTVTEAWRADDLDPAMALDSVTTWTGPDRRAYVLATAKEDDRLVLFAADDGSRVRHVGFSGAAPGELAFPNGLANAGGVAWIVERDNRRVQLLDPADGRSLGVFGSEHLERPVGLWVEPVDAAAGRFQAWVTDDYTAADGSVPPAEALDRRVHVFAVVLDEGRLVGARHVRSLGRTRGAGVLRRVESIHGDPAYDRVLIAEEDIGTRPALKAYDLAGDFRLELVGAGVFAHQPEGIALAACDDGSGYWIASDQDPQDQRFHVFDRASLKLRGSFRGAQVRNTDGLWFEPAGFAGFARGVLYAQHDDRALVAFDWGEVADALGLSTCPE